MESQGILQNQRFRTAVILAAVAAGLDIALNIFAVGNGEVVSSINSAASVIFSILAFGLFLRVWFFTDIKDFSKGMWGGFTLGALLWAMAEVVWFFYDAVLQIEIPYPSLADLLWLVAYIPFWVAIKSRYDKLHYSLNLRQRGALVIFIGCFLLLMFNFVLKPIITAFDPERIAESILNILYPLADFVTLILTCLMLFSIGRGRFVAATWGLIALGLVCFSVSDLFYSYLTWNELYYPDGNVNLATILVDLSYSFSYLFWGVGAYAYSLLLEIKYTVKLSVDAGKLTKTRILVFIDAKNKIITFSDNFMLLVGTENKFQYNNMPLHRALGVDAGIMDNILEKIAKQGAISNYPLTMGTVEQNNVLLTALVLVSPQNKYDGAGIVLTTDLAVKNGDVPPLSPEQKGLVEYFLEKAGIDINEDTQVLKYYFLEQIRLLYSLTYEFHGQHSADALLDFIAQKAQENGWKIHIDEQRIFIPEEYEGQVLVASLSKLLGEARSFIAYSVSLSLVDQEMSKFDQSLGDDTLKIVDMYGLRTRDQVAF
jgi:hypothetical protein